jgi:hypothetical protein
VLQDVAAALKAEGFPEGSGIAVMFATDFQEESAEGRAAWLKWSQTPGRVLLLAPPFSVGPCEDPLRWEALPWKEGKSAGDASLSSLLATEVRHEIQGELQPARELGGVWADYAVNTAFYRKHPNAGLFAVTALPIWSMTLLDHAPALNDWFTSLHAMAGTPSAQAAQEEPEFQLQPNHYAVLLHLIGGRFESRDDTLAALGASPIFRLSPDEAAARLDELQQQGLAENGRVTEQGREALRQSPYEAFASELETLAAR